MSDSSCIIVSFCCVLSLFMISTHLSTYPRSENLDSRHQVEVLKETFGKMSKDLGPSAQHMMNLTWDSGDPMGAAWIPLYWVRKLHMGAIPVYSWLVIAPIQVSASMRRNYPWLHHLLGYIFFVASSAIVLGLVLLMASGRVYGYPHWLAMTMDISKLGYLASSLLMAIWHAQQRNLQHHQRWITRHLAMGYTVSFQRVVLLVVGPILHAYGWVDLPTSHHKQIWYNFTTFVSTVPLVVIVELSLRSRPKKVKVI